MIGTNWLLGLWCYLNWWLHEQINCVECELFLPSIIEQLYGMYSSVTSCYWLAPWEALLEVFPIISHEASPIPGSTTLTICISLLPYWKRHSTVVYCLHQFLNMLWFFLLIFFLVEEELSLSFHYIASSIKFSVRISVILNIRCNSSRMMWSSEMTRSGLWQQQ